MGTDAPSAMPVRLERDHEIAVLVIDNPPVNAGSAAVRRALVEALDAIAHKDGVEGVVVIGAGKTFMSGSDIREFAGPLQDPQLPAVIAAIQNFPKPVVAAIHGAALGGGYELALGCDARIATADAILGLPEVTLGVIPGAGGTQRLPRLVGPVAAIELITSGRRVPAAEASKLGMVDALAEKDLRAGAIALAKSLRGEKRRVDDRPIPQASQEDIAAAENRALARSRGVSAVGLALQSLRTARHLAIGDGLARERAVFQELRVGEEATALRHLFFAERQAARMADAYPPPPDLKRVGIAGAGTMGSAIALCFADAGYDVVLADTNPASLAGGLKRIDDVYARAVSSGRMSADKVAEARGRIRSTAALNDLAGCDLAVEAVFEDMAVKKAVLAELDRLLGPGALIASNTSYLNLDELAEATERPAQVVGLHFFSPANVMRLLEIVQGRHTAPATLAAAFHLAKRLRKVAILARVGEGFIGNRIYNAYRSQCEYLIEEGAWPEEVDAALEEFGFAMGPFAVGDLSGLDIAWRARQRLAATRDPRARYVDILDRLCQAGRLGRKSGAGWYNYPKGSGKGEADPKTRALIVEASTSKSITRRTIGKEEILARALGAILNEAALVLDDGIARHPADIDLAMVHGYGFPARRGGPVFWASRRNPAEIRQALDQAERATGFGFRRGDVAAMLSRLTAEAGDSNPPRPSPPPAAARE